MLAFLAAWSAGAPARACPNCFGSTESNVYLMYQYSTVWLSLLPFAIVGAIVVTARHFARAALRDRASAERDRSAADVGPRVVPLHGRPPLG